MIAFGPVPSRRLGKSLGVNNITAHKNCSYSCVYCQIGITNILSANRVCFYEPYVLLSEVEKHIKKLDNKDMPDYLTFVAKREPTLDINIGKEIKLLKSLGFPVALITNSSLIGEESVREDISNADWISLKVDSVDNDVWKKINQPNEHLNLEKILEGIALFAKAYRGSLHTETMLVAGYNDTERILKQNSEFITSLNVETAFLSIPIRPPAIKNIKSVSEAKIAEAWQIYNDSGINTELIVGFEGTLSASTGNVAEDILNITAVHPLREDSIMQLLEQNGADFTIIELLLEQKRIIKTNYTGYNYYLRNLNK